ncbi:TIGR03759 family integrating conjugative element protein [Erwinia sp. S59]|uniref:TIGR03759 family integrating conjugative element protein n=1 Tax=Erwinia sp. S59 TaxID=2769340 RepID=UPI0019094475|nr:TIGR03759 family integrating conjugative element protein [Erwinia sp. S59]MBK0091788.1 TIGR03759 family integrating conjugative element protein [Erwinia sp. S59]
MLMLSKTIIIASALIVGFTPFANAVTRPEITKHGEQKISDIKDEYIDSYQTLSDAELLKYNALMSGYRGYVYPNLDPLSLLGIESQNDSERRHYAELWVKQEYERTEKELKFQREVDAAWKRLMPNMLPVNMGNAAGIAHDSGGRLALFVREADCQRCDARLSAVLADKRPVDIYLVDSEGSDQKLRNWAQQHRIPAEQVRERRITLNHDAGRWLRYGNGIMPVLLQQGENGWHIAAF